MGNEQSVDSGGADAAAAAPEAAEAAAVLTCTVVSASNTADHWLSLRPVKFYRVDCSRGASAWSVQRRYREFR
eukprot:7012665-Prymnesium_polylepis.1